MPSQNLIQIQYNQIPKEMLTTESRGENMPAAIINQLKCKYLF